MYFRTQPVLPSPKHPSVWLHAASLGDVNALSPFTQALLDQSFMSSSLSSRSSISPPLAHRFKLHVSATTSSGRLQWKRKFPTLPVHLPPLGPPPHARWLAYRYRPSLLILELLEIWPQWIYSWHRQGIPMGVINGRISDSTYRAQKYLKSSFSRLSFFLAQTPRDAQRALDLGVPAEGIKVFGNSKYEQWNLSLPLHDRSLSKRTMSNEVHLLESPPSSCKSTPINQELFDVVIANLQADEEDACFHFLAEKLVDPMYASLKWCIVPRHLSRLSRLKKRANHLLHTLNTKKTGQKRTGHWTLHLRSFDPDPWHDKPPRSAFQSKTLSILDQYGELADLYPYVKVVIMGGTFGKRQGQSLIEPARFGCPIIYGPSRAKIHLEHHLLKEQNGFPVQSWSNAFELLPSLLQSPRSFPNLSPLKGALDQQLHWMLNSYFSESS